MLNIKTRDLLATHIVACEQAFCLGKGYAMKKFLSVLAIISPNREPVHRLLP